MIGMFLIWLGVIALFGATIVGVAEFTDRRKMRRRQSARRDEFRAGIRYRAWREVGALGTWLP